MIYDRSKYIWLQIFISQGNAKGEIQSWIAFIQIRIHSAIYGKGLAYFEITIKVMEIYISPYVNTVIQDQIKGIPTSILIHICIIRFNRLWSFMVMPSPFVMMHIPHHNCEISLVKSCMLTELLYKNDQTKF